MALNIVLPDAQATPANRTFVPIGRDKNDTFWFEDQSATNAIGYWKISVELKRPSSPAAGTPSDGKRVIRAKISLNEPILETVTNATVSGISPAPTVSYVPRAFAEIVMPERATIQNRKDLRKMMAALLVDTQVVSVVENFAYLS